MILGDQKRKTWNKHVLDKLDMSDPTPRWMVAWDDDTIPVRRFIVHFDGYFWDNHDIPYQHANEDVWPMICKEMTTIPKVDIDKFCDAVHALVARHGEDVGNMEYAIREICTNCNVPVISVYRDPGMMTFMPRLIVIVGICGAHSDTRELYFNLL